MVRPVPPLPRPAYALAVFLTAAGPPVRAAPLVAGWPVVGGDAGGSRYSPLADIDRSNVGRLQVAWTYRHGDYRSGWPLRDARGTAFQTTPILVDDLLVFTTPYNRVIALDPETGAERWAFDPALDKSALFPNMLINRGVATWRDPNADGPCASRVYLATLDARLIALDTRTGRPCDAFGTAGSVNLRDGITPLVDPLEYYVTSPATVVGDRVIVGSAIADMIRRIQPPGAVRAYDARTGDLVWRFNTIPRAGEPGVETWEGESWRHTGAANVWSTMTADPGRGLVFLPVSTAGPDFYGGDRPGANLFSDAVVALEARAGRLVWHFQTVHHDLWDYDLAAPPNLVRVRGVDAVAQATKAGFVFLLERDTGQPLFPVEERPVPASDVPGERAWPTQPAPLKPPPLVPQRLTEADLWDADPPHRERCLERLRELRNDGLFTPPSERGSVVYPFTGGGANWSGAAFDPEHHLLYVPANNLVHTVRLDPLPPDNFLATDGVVVGSPLLGGLWWTITGLGTGLRYWMQRDLFAENGRPCNKPPWGLLTAVDLDEGTFRWQVPVGEHEGVRGLANYGPPLATAGGLVFHAGSFDLRLRAHHSLTGAVLATFPLPAALHGGIITYKLRPDGKQYLVVAAGGHSVLRTPLGDHVIAYTLPGDS